MKRRAEDRAAQCDGKEAYRTRGLADRVANRRNFIGRNLSVYRCPHCGGWHMGRLARTKRPKIEELT